MRDNTVIAYVVTLTFILFAGVLFTKCGTERRICLNMYGSDKQTKCLEIVQRTQCPTYVE
jgi:hypothetical protein